MTSSDVTETFHIILQASRYDEANVVHKPRLLSDNGASYISGEIKDCVQDNEMSHVRGAPYHSKFKARSNIDVFEFNA